MVCCYPTTTPPPYIRIRHWPDYTTKYFIHINLHKYRAASKQGYGT